MLELDVIVLELDVAVRVREVVVVVLKVDVVVLELDVAVRVREVVVVVLKVDVVVLEVDVVVLEVDAVVLEVDAVVLEVDAVVVVPCSSKYHRSESFAVSCPPKSHMRFCESRTKWLLRLMGGEVSAVASVQTSPPGPRYCRSLRMTSPLESAEPLQTHIISGDPATAACSSLAAGLLATTSVQVSDAVSSTNMLFSVPSKLPPKIHMRSLESMTALCLDLRLGRLPLAVTWTQFWVGVSK